MKKKRVFLKKQTRKFRSDKKNPKRAVVSIVVDRDAFQDRTDISFPEEAEIERRLIPKTKNENLVTIYLGCLKLCWYLAEGKGFIYHFSGKYLGNLKKSDLKKAFSEIGHLLREII